MPSISVILPTRDRPERLVVALESVGRQTHAEMELVLVRDGGAPLGDAAERRIDALQFPTIRIEHEGPAEGPARSRNRGIAEARGEALAFLDDDDAWEPYHLASLTRALDAESDRDAVYADARILEEATGAERMLAQEFDLARLERNSFIPPSALLARRSAFDRFGLFDESLACSEDWDWLLRVARGGGTIARARACTVVVRIHAGGLSRLTAEHLAVRARALDELARRHRLGPLEPKTFWEVAATLAAEPRA